MADPVYNNIKEDELIVISPSEKIESKPLRHAGISELAKQSFKEAGGMTDFFTMGDSTFINDFTNFNVSASGSGTTVANLKVNYVTTGATQNSTAIISKQINSESRFAANLTDFKMFINYYIDEYWSDGEIPGAKIWIKFGRGIGADEGSAGDDAFGVRIEEVSGGGGSLKATAFARSPFVIADEVILTNNLEVTDKFNIGFSYRIFNDNDGILDFYLNDKKKGEISITFNEGMEMNLTHAASNPVAGSSADGTIHQAFFLFKGTKYPIFGRDL